MNRLKLEICILVDYRFSRRGLGAENDYTPRVTVLIWQYSKQPAYNKDFWFFPEQFMKKVYDSLLNYDDILKQATDKFKLYVIAYKMVFPESSSEPCLDKMDKRIAFRDKPVEFAGGLSANP